VLSRFVSWIFLTRFSRLPAPVGSARLVPSGEDLPLERQGDRVTIRLPKFSCHGMVEFQC
jgi:hypothetical protein